MAFTKIKQKKGKRKDMIQPMPMPNDDWVQLVPLVQLGVRRGFDSASFLFVSVFPPRKPLRNKYGRWREKGKVIVPKITR